MVQQDNYLRSQSNVGHLYVNDTSYNETNLNNNTTVVAMVEVALMTAHALESFCNIVLS
jgi:hypothetical protein